MLQKRQKELWLDSSVHHVEKNSRWFKGHEQFTAASIRSQMCAVLSQQIFNINM